ncbi:undecaprenyl-diphosphate phosphatase [Calycomorphotria hydatis]|uniref:Undecaprenyl-diphosphatase n=1 Tax=Calycomorphotria hydatis TaxID=2528027 RepID=A0A517TAI0_9PLAN|nr:undecaprenyl-diphosphate phosphatase [Calycomorphotria hydatis]QDT65373.1 Undecaprenyl-diphosphatase [Calycomorphotria hydatis]
MSYLHALLLGVIQGLTEFLPVSSSGHIVIADALLASRGDQAVQPAGTVMNIALHVGTLASIVVIYYREIWKALRDRHTLLTLIIATIPLVLLYPAKDTIEQAFNSPLVAGCGLLVTATLLLVSERLRSTEGTEKVSYLQAVIIGCFQMIAPCPGISRSGSTIAGGLIAGVDRRVATTFSFLIAIPAIGGSAAAYLLDYIRDSENTTPIAIGPTILGMLAAFLVGVFALKLMINLVARRRLWIFVGYCAVVGVATILWQTLS